ncbi:nucleotidyltransferase domain-containing protein [Micromonospora sp. WMMD964]|uniref:nucleotidyltransferase domain-containing protein n=1 Tax=Micromonospora sp. WMMD964 TaxID=3016091 RepID=UPI00249AE224|nr:nucleotidyltransferase domain-containing protein [Micromonospora sp. WMMD964]WFF00197.1 nucleotidyltransferase domain-containing protein [Micromonospora sp. WMMD964]
MNLTAIAEELRATLSDYLALLEYGSRARGTYSANSDFDLIVVTESRHTPFRFHTKQVDLNITSLQSLEFLHRRMLINEEAPWDGIFASIRIIHCIDFRVEALIQSIRESFSSPTERSGAAVDGLRFSLARVIEDMVGIRDAQELRLLAGQAVHVYLFSWVMLQGGRWSGLREAWRRFRANDGIRSRQLGLVPTYTEWERAVATLRPLESWLFANFGGAWRNEVLSLAGGFERADGDESIPLTAEQTTAINILCSRASDPRH